jgi:hypothetical protein
MILELYQYERGTRGNYNAKSEIAVSLNAQFVSDDVGF